MRARMLRSLLLVPALLLMAFVVFIPAIQAVILAFTGDAGLITANVRAVLTDPVLGGALRNTIVFLVLLLPVQGLVALALALAIGTRIRAGGLILSLIVLPLAVSDLAAGLLWLAVFTDRGYLNSALQSAGLIAQPISWLGFDSYGGVVAAIVVAETWRTTGVVLLPMLGPAASWREVLSRFRSRLPMALALRTILALQTFAVVFALAGRNFPVLSGEAYAQLAANRDEHLAAGYVVVIVAIATLAGAAYLRLATARER